MSEVLVLHCSSCGRIGNMASFMASFYDGARRRCPDYPSRRRVA